MNADTPVMVVVDDKKVLVITMIIIMIIIMIIFRHETMTSTVTIDFHVKQYKIAILTLDYK